MTDCGVGVVVGGGWTRGNRRVSGGIGGIFRRGGSSTSRGLVILAEHNSLLLEM